MALIWRKTQWKIRKLIKNKINVEGEAWPGHNRQNSTKIKTYEGKRLLLCYEHERIPEFQRKQDCLIMISHRACNWTINMPFILQITVKESFTLLYFIRDSCNILYGGIQWFFNGTSLVQSCLGATILLGLSQFGILVSVPCSLFQQLLVFFSMVTMILSSAVIFHNL